MKKENGGGKEGKRVGRREKERGKRNPLQPLWSLGQGGRNDAFRPLSKYL